MSLAATRSVPERLITVGKAFWFYLGKLVWPHALTTIYPRWQIDAARWPEYLPLAAMFVALWVCWRQRHTWTRGGLFVWGVLPGGLATGVGRGDHPLL